MKKKTFIIVLLIFIMSVFTAFANNFSNKFKGEEEFRKAGEDRKSSIKNLINSEKVLHERKFIGTIDGEDIEKEYFEARYNAYKTSPLNYENPGEEAWKSIQREVKDKNFAKEKGILPTEAEIEAYVFENRSLFDETEEGRAFIKAYAEGMDMTEDEYWEYNKKYEAPLAVTHAKVEKYILDNGLKPLDYDDINATIAEKEYFENLE